MNKRRHLYKAPHDVYRVRDAAGALLYVGCSINAFKRHKNEYSPWFPLAATVDVVQYSDMASAQFVEAQAIEVEAPMWNRQGEPRALRREHLANTDPVDEFTGIPVSEFWVTT
jgi:hypothetical protein